MTASQLVSLVVLLQREDFWAQVVLRVLEDWGALVILFFRSRTTVVVLEESRGKGEEGVEFVLEIAFPPGFLIGVLCGGFRCMGPLLGSFVWCPVTRRGGGHGAGQS